MRDIILGGRRYSAADVFAAQHQLQWLRREVDAQFREAIDVLVVPTSPAHPTHAEVARDPLGENSALGYYTNFVNLLDLAAVAIPAGLAQMACRSGSRSSARPSRMTRCWTWPRS